MCDCVTVHVCSVCMLECMNCMCQDVCVWGCRGVDVMVCDICWNVDGVSVEMNVNV